MVIAQLRIVSLDCIDLELPVVELPSELVVMHLFEVNLLLDPFVLKSCLVNSVFVCLGCISCLSHLDCHGLLLIFEGVIFAFQVSRSLLRLIQ